MARHARLVLSGIPHHVTQRGNRRDRVFFSPADYRHYRNLIAQAAKQAGTEVWAYCFMPNHIHLVMVPGTAAGLSKALADPARRYALEINKRLGWTGHLWESRFSSVPMEESHLVHAIRYVSLNPVRAGLVRFAEKWPWSSVRAHLAGRDDDLVTVAPVLSRFPDFKSLVEESRTDGEFAVLRGAERSSRPVGSREFIARAFRKGDS